MVGGGYVSPSRVSVAHGAAAEGAAQAGVGAEGGIEAVDAVCAWVGGWGGVWVCGWVVSEKRRRGG